jgi:hypothetical protein
MSEFLKVYETTEDKTIRWINLEAVMFVVSTKTQQGDRLNIKFIDSTNLVIDGELTKELKIALDHLSVNNCLPDERDFIKHFDDIPTREEIEAMDEGNNDYSDEAEYEEADEYKDSREAIDALHGFNTDWRDYLNDYDRQFIDQ